MEPAEETKSVTAEEFGDFFVWRGIKLSRRNIIAHDLIPHREVAISIIDGVQSFDNDKIVLTKELTANDLGFEGHFPAAPIFPGHWQIEMCLLAAAMLNLLKFGHNEDLPAPCKITEVRFHLPALPGDTLYISACQAKKRGRMFMCQANITNQHKQKVMEIDSIWATSIPAKFLSAHDK